jgi:hypothetical protein
MSTTNAQTSAMMPAELSLLTNENENIPPFSSVSIALPSVPPLGERSVNVPTPAATTLTLTEQEKKQLKKAQKKAMDNVEKRRLIDEANRRERRNESLVPLVITQKERKSVIRFEDDLKPAFYPGAYVRVDRDYSPGKNRQEGYGWVEALLGSELQLLSQFELMDVCTAISLLIILLQPSFLMMGKAQSGREHQLNLS